MRYLADAALIPGAVPGTERVADRVLIDIAADGRIASVTPDATGPARSRARHRRLP